MGMTPHVLTPSVSLGSERQLHARDLAAGDEEAAPGREVAAARPAGARS